MRRRFVGKVALVSGAGSGIGEAVALRLAAEGADVVVFDVDPTAAERVASAIDGVAVAGEASDPEDAGRAVEAAVKRFGGVDVLVTASAGAEGAGALLDTADSAWDAGMVQHLDRCVVTTMAALPSLLERHGTIVVVSSIGALASAPAAAARETANAGLLGLVRSLAVDYGPQGLRANVLCPGWARTPAADRVLATMSGATPTGLDEAYARATAAVPLGRAAEASELAAVCAFLASDDAAYVTGTTMVADGGTMAVTAGAGLFGSRD